MSDIRKFFLLFFLIAKTYSVFSQIAPGEWRTHFSFNSANQVVYADDKVYVEASNKLYSYSNIGEIKTYSTLTGLNGHNVSYLGWCKSEKTLIIVYSDGNIDFLTNSGIINLPDLKNKSVPADKTVYGLRIVGNKAYLSTGIGLLVLDVANREISENYYLKFSSTYTKVYDAASWSDTVVVATQSGLYWGNVASNLQDASSWSLMASVPQTKITKLVRFNDQLFAYGENGNVYRKNASGWSVLFYDPGITKMLVEEDYLFICAGKNTYMYNSDFQLQDIESIQNKGIAIDITNNLLYIASGTNGLCKLSKVNGKYSVLEDSIMANGPAANTSWKGLFKDDVLYFTSGGQAQNWGNRAFYSGNILTFKDEEWSSLSNIKDIEKASGVSFMDILTLAIDPKDNRHYFMTSWGEGLYEFRDSSFYKLYTNRNSPFVSCIQGDSTHYIRVDGANFDADGNLWVLCSGSDNPLQILKNEDGKYENWCRNLHYANMPWAPTWNSILFTKSNQVWMNSLRHIYGIFVLDNNNTLEDTSDDQTRWFNSFTDQEGNILSPWAINCVTEDLNGSIWLGTTSGPIVASNPSNVFNSDFYFTRIKIPRDDGSGNADYLLNDIRINCITVDGANRKWIGTNGNGVYLISSDGLKTVHYFSTENSPLPSDYIWSITINPETGEVFIGTDVGLASYRSDATQGVANYSGIHVFPNPVKPEHTGNITVTGLMENTQVKITDFAGNVLIEGTSLGGQFSWNGYTKQGKRAASGVYLVFCVSEDGIENQACKFMIIN